MENSIEQKLKTNFTLSLPMIFLIVFALGVVAAVVVALAPFATLYFTIRLFFNRKSEAKKTLPTIVQNQKSKKLTMVEFLNSNLSVVKN